MTRAHFQQFYVQPDNVHNDRFVLDGEEFIHAARVLRMKTGDAIEAVDGQGNLYSGKIISMSSKELVAGIYEQQLNAGEPKLYLTLAQAVPKGSNFDLVVEKGTEIGISAFQPVITARSIVSPEARGNRWGKKALVAMKQCGRSRCPDILPPLDFTAALELYTRDLLIIAHESHAETRTDLDKRIASATRVTLFIGPEGGFTAEEFARALQFGALPMNLGPRRLRSETAGLVAAIKILDMARELE
ncbi:MAG TPA: RsmE family RNA methyltransferase [bacterium]|nr:RsmE family RNA methyltransferase [bacterium]HPN45770.1 RsmE family RNA methyltransferase [bacterium]